MPQNIEDRELLAELLNRRPKSWWTNQTIEPLNIAPSDLPAVPPAPMFRPGTPVLGDARLQQGVEEMFRTAPELRGRINSIQTAPTPSVIEDFMASKIPVHRMENTNLMGQYDPVRKDIYLNPLMGKAPAYPMEASLAHEMGHAAGRQHGPDIELLEEIGRRMLPETVYSPETGYKVPQR